MYTCTNFSTRTELLHDVWDIRFSRVHTEISPWALVPRDLGNRRLGSPETFCLWRGIGIPTPVPLVCRKRQHRGAEKASEDSLLCMTAMGDGVREAYISPNHMVRVAECAWF